MGDDVDEHPFSGLDGFSPFVFERAVFATVKAGILGEVIEPFARAIESSGDEMAAIVSTAPVRLARICLRAP